MRVLMFGWEFPPHISGGLGTACYGLTKGLASHGVEIDFVVPKAYGDEDQSIGRFHSAGDVEFDIREKSMKEFWDKVKYLEIGSNLIPYVSPEEFERIVSTDILSNQEIEERVFSTRFKFSGKYGNDLMQEVSRYALIGAVLAKNLDFDVIHAHDWLTYAAGIAAKQVSGKPLIVHMHATEFDRSGQHVNQQVFDIERKGMLAADRVITVSNLTRSIVNERYYIPLDKITTVYNAVEPPKVSPGDGDRSVREKVVTFLGRITFQKGPDYFIEAAKKVLDHDRNIRFVMAGSGDMLNRMVRRAAELGISDRFHFTGFLSSEFVHKMFSISDVYVMPSVSEPFGISPLEAMRSNVPVIISKQSGVSEVLEHAIKVDFWDIDGMADSIYGLLNYKGVAELFKRFGKTEVNNLKWDKAAAEVVQVYQDVIQTTTLG
ncbi:MAG TPA: glycosyltransferase family 4 protein [Salinivirga sp.]|uniref:glycosyltransferase family 4 protein n=1 Tax=Salinivirga sp. TaxID=1970192 RepID=UPI002B463AC3|nr:glycosyltransferase family 4 protein [Salinivirga sp.]HKK59434.1 glycosyltransferase family 4 protein [Salinivirga sp.]